MLHYLLTQNKHALREHERERELECNGHSYLPFPLIICIMIAVCQVDLITDLSPAWFAPRFVSSFEPHVLGWDFHCNKFASASVCVFASA